MRAIPSSIASLLAVAGCAYPPALGASLAERVEVAGTGSDVKVAPRPAGCDVQFFRTKPPDRAYDEIAALHLSVFADVDAASVQEALRARACAAGADAVVVTREYASAGGYAGMAGVAVSYPELREGHQAALAARRVEEERTRRELRARRPAGVPDGWVEGTVARDLVLRATAERRSAELGEVAAGTALWVSPVARGGYRRVFVSQGLSGYAEESDVALDGAAAPGATPAAVPAKRAGAE